MSPGKCPSVSRSSSSCSERSHSSHASRSHRPSYGRRRRSSSSSSRSSSSSAGSRGRSRSHPRCNRNSSRCRCATHRRRQSPPRRSRNNSCSCSPSPVRSSRYRRSYRSRSRSGSWRSGTSSRAAMGRRRDGRHRSHPRSYRRSTSVSPRQSPIISVMQEKMEVVRRAEEEDTMEVPSVEDGPVAVESCPGQLDRVRPLEQPGTSSSPQVSDEEHGGLERSTLSPSRKIVFSIHNSVAKPAVSTVPSAKVTSRVDSYENRRPYGHWTPVRRDKVPHKRASH